MENRPFEPEDQDDLDPQASGKKKRSSTFSKFLSNLRRKDYEKLDSEEEEHDAESEKPRRFRSLFNRLFPSVVENPNQLNTSEREHPMDYEAWFSWKPSQKESGPEVKTESSEASAAEVSPSTTSAEGEAPNVRSELRENPDWVTNETSEASENVPHDTAASEQPDRTSAEITLSNSGEHELYVRRQSVRDAEAQPTSLTTSERNEREVVIERGPGMALPVALVGLEYLGRKKADKKLESRVNEKITATNKEVNRGAALQQELDTMVRQNREQLEALKQARSGRTQEAAPVTRPMAERFETSRPQATPEAPRQAPEVTRSAPVEQLPPSAGKEERFEEVKPQKILEQVADAAEHNIAVERVFERSHEVKDDQTVPGAAASIGSVMATHAKTAHYQTPPQPQSRGTRHDGSLPFVSSGPGTAAYKQAMAAGFWAAVMIIILGSIAYLVIK